MPKIAMQIKISFSTCMSLPFSYTKIECMRETREYVHKIKLDSYLAGCTTRSLAPLGRIHYAVYEGYGGAALLFRPVKEKPNRAIWILFAILALAIIWPIWLAVSTALGAATLTYDVTPSEVVITFGPKTTRIDRAKITDVWLIERPTKGRRLFGTSLPGLKEGRWSFEETGSITLFATTLRPLLVIETDGGKWGISPEEPEAFLDALQAGGAGEFSPVPGGGSGPYIGLILVLLLSAGIVIALIYYTFRVSRNLAYELGATDVVVHGPRQPIRIPYAKITHVEHANPGGAPWRTLGIGMPGLRWGSFAWKEAGPNLQLYATRYRPLVLISAGIQTYGVTPEEADRFVAELKQRIQPED